METQIVILAGGKGTRMGATEIPKVLIPMAGKPMIKYLLEELTSLKDIPVPVIVVGYKHAQVMEALGSKYVYALQKEQLGTGHAVWSAQPQIQARNIIVLYGDMPFIRAESIKRLIRTHRDNHACISMFTCTVPNFNGPYATSFHYGRIIRDKFGNILRSTEYRDATEDERKIREVNPCIYMFDTEWLWENIDKIQNHNEQREYYLTDIVAVAIEDNKPLHSLAISPEEIFGVNTPDHLQDAESIVRRRQSS